MFLATVIWVPEFGSRQKMPAASMNGETAPPAPQP